MAKPGAADGGRTFGEPSIIELDGVNPDGTPTDTNISNDKEWVTADPFSGTVYVTWTAFTFDADGNFVEAPIMLRKSTDFGRTWGAAVRVAPTLDGFSGGITPFDQGSGLVTGNTLQGEFIGDYTAIAIGTDVKVHPAWTDFRGNPGINTPNQDMYTQSLPAL